MGHGVYAMLLSFIRQLVVLVPSAYLLARWGRQAGNDDLVWLSYPIAEFVSIVVALLLFRSLYRNVIAQLPLNGEESCAEGQTA